ncbi:MULTISPECIES: universal stress protein [Streptomyces]|uniref:universal stress protein n=1 Tax=Streptomyces TaxID=1883 RepID=UPI003460B8C0
MELGIAVGIDGSAASVCAVRWAAREALSLGVPVRLVHASVPDALTREGLWQETVQRERGLRLLHDASIGLRDRNPGLCVSRSLITQDATTALLAAADDAELLTLGRRDLGPVERSLLPDTGMQVAARADRPVVFVRADGRKQPHLPDADPTGVAVGLCLRHPCEELLRFAFRMALQHGTAVRAVHGVSLPAAADALWSSSPETVEAAAAVAGQGLCEVLRPWRERFPWVRVLDEVAFDSAARALVSAASRSGLLVVGHRRARHFPASPLGPVARAAIRHAICPVAVVTHD